jgi:hypothetical protein
MSDAVLGALILVPLVVVIWVVAWTVSKVGDAWSASVLARLAPTIDGTVSRAGPHVSGSYGGLPVRISFTKGQAVGTGESASQMNAFYIEALDLAGDTNWKIAFRAVSWTGQDKELFIESPDAALAERLRVSGALELIGRVNMPSNNYVTVAYDARAQTLTYTDDVSPKLVPSVDHFVRELELVGQLTTINAATNPVRP